MRILAISCAVPKNESPIENSIGSFSEETVKKIIRNTGIKSRRIAPRGMMASDLAFHASEVLFEATGVEKSSVDAIIFVSQTADYLVPTTSSLLQHRLGLPDSIFSLDLNKGCTGYTDGLIVAQGLLAGLGMNRILLIVADTLSKMTDSKDQSTAMLFGDAASATLLERSDQPFSHVQGTDGSGFEAIHQDTGYRRWDDEGAFPIPFEAIATKVDGVPVFEFTIKRIPPAVEELLHKAAWTIDGTDAFVFHQANLFILKHLGRKMGITMDKIPISLERFGNTSGASIPMTIVTEMASISCEARKLVLVGFGVGLAWSGVAFPWSGNEIVCPLIEM